MPLEEPVNLLSAPLNLLSAPRESCLSPSKRSAQVVPSGLSLPVRRGRICPLELWALVLAALLTALLTTACGGEAEERAPDQSLPAAPEPWESSLDLPMEGALMNVWGDDESGAAPSLIGGQPDAGSLWRAEGGGEAARWSIEPTPAGQLLNWMHGAGERRWVVGNGGRILRSDGGGAWEEVESGTGEDLWGVWAASADEAWAVGGDPLADPPAPTLLHFSDGRWSSLELPPLDRGGVQALFKVWGFSPTQVFAVGSKGVLLAYDGSQWRQEAIEPVEGSPPITDDLISLWGNQSGDLIAVGGRANGLVARWDGSRWRGKILAGVPGLNGIWVDEAGVGTAVGIRGAVLRFEAGDFTFERERTESTLVLHSVWGDRAGNRWAVGGSLDSTPPWEGIALLSPSR